MRIKSLVVLLSTVLASGAHAEPEQDRWKLDDLYATPAAWDADAARLTDQTKQLAGCKGQLGRSAARFKTCLDLADDVQKRMGRLGVYGSEFYNQDTSDSAGLAFFQKTQLLDAKLTEATSFMGPEILVVGKTKIDGFLRADKSLIKYRHSLDEILRAAPRHTRSTPTAKPSSPRSA